MADGKTSKNVKKRNWAFVLYPESAPDNWQEYLTETGLQCAISPLHQFDVNPTGEIKKAHYHVILCYSGPTSFNVVKKLTDELNQPIPQALEQVKGYYRYFTHKDNPEKYQYNDEDIQTINGFNILDYSDLTRTEVNLIKRRLIAVIRENEIIEYSDFMNYVNDNLTEEDFDIAVNNTLFFNSYISSLRHSKIGE